MRKLIRFLFISAALLFVLFIAAAIIIPVVYKDRILAVVKTELNEHLDASTDFKDISISLFSHFPHLSVSIKDISIVGKESFRHDTLIAAPQADLVLDIKKALKGKYDILKIDLVKPRIHAIVRANGKANWDIVKPSADTTAATPERPHRFSIDLRHYAITKGYISYCDQKQKITATIEDLDHEGSGDFSNDLFVLKTKTSAQAITIIAGKIPYISKVKASLDFDITVDNKNNKYSFDTKDIKINGLNLSAKGFVQLPDTAAMIVDVQFSTPSNDFKDILSLVPGIYQDNFKDIQTTGNASVTGMMKGKYSHHEIPAFKINLTVKDGSLQYPGLPQKISDIQLLLTASNPDGVPDHTVINLEKGHIVFGTDPFDFHLLVTTPVSDKRIEAYAKGKIDLSQMKSFVKLDDGTKITGTVTADVAFKGTLADAEKRDLDSLDASGIVTVDNLTYTSKEYPDPVSLSSLSLTFSPENITVSNMKAQYLNTSFTGDGNLNNLLGYYLHKGTLTGSIHLVADRIDGNKWKETFTTPKSKVKAPKPTTPPPAETPFVAPPDLNISFNAEVDEIEYDHVKIKNVQGLMVIGNEVINIQDVQAHALEGEVKINGFYSSVEDKANPKLDFEYLVSLGRLTVLKKHIDHL